MTLKEAIEKEDAARKAHAKATDPWDTGEGYELEDAAENLRLALTKALQGKP